MRNIHILIDFTGEIVTTPSDNTLLCTMQVGRCEHHSLMSWMMLGIHLSQGGVNIH